MGSALLYRGGATTATIADTLATPSPTIVPHVTTQPRAVSENKIRVAALGISSDEIRYFEEGTGKAFSVNVRTQKTTSVSSEKILGFQGALWIPQAQQSLYSVQTPKGTQWYHRNYTRPTAERMSSEFTGATASPNGKSIAYFTPSDDGSVLRIADSSGENGATILATRTESAVVQWIDDSTLALLTQRPDRPGRDLSLVDQRGKITTILTNRENLETTWSPDGTQALISYFTPETGISLWHYRISSGESTPLAIETSAAKCAWATDSMSITCGVPMQNTLTRDVPADRTATVDHIETLDFTSGERTRNYTGVQGTLLGVTAPLMSSSGDYFVFTNMFDSRLYALPLH